jgi:hypothetical protein
VAFVSTAFLRANVQVNHYGFPGGDMKASAVLCMSQLHHPSRRRIDHFWIFFKIKTNQNTTVQIGQVRMGLE